MADALRGRHPALKVLYTSGYSDDAILRQGSVQGEVPLHRKPSTPKALARRVREDLDGTAADTRPFV